MAHELTNTTRPVEIVTQTGGTSSQGKKMAQQGASGGALVQPPRYRPTFRKTPREFVQIDENQSTILECRVENRDPNGYAIWMKDNLHIYTGEKRENGFERFKLSGNLTEGDYDLELNNLTLEDSGIYSCKFLSGFEDDNMTDYNLVAKTNLTVVSQPILPPTIQQINNGTTSSSYLDASASNNKQTNQLQARDIPNSATKLFSTSAAAAAAAASSPAQNSPLSPYYASPAFISGSPSSAQSPRINQQNASHQQSSFQFANLILSWPYLLMLFAALLFLANVYLIYSLVKRHRLNQSNKQQKQAQCDASNNNNNNNNSSSGSSVEIHHNHMQHTDQVDCGFQTNSSPELSTVSTNIQIQPEDYPQQLQLNQNHLQQHHQSQQHLQIQIQPDQQDHLHHHHQLHMHHIQHHLHHMELDPQQEQQNLYQLHHHGLIASNKPELVSWLV